MDGEIVANYVNILMGFVLISNIFSIISCILQAWGLYMINKKLGEKYAWLSWIPVINFYSFVKASGKNGIWCLWIILGLIAFIIPGLVMIIMVLHSISKRTGRGVWTTLGFIFIPFIMYPVVGYKLKDSSIQSENTISQNVEL